MTLQPRWYLVESPPYLYTEPVLDYGEGPTTEEREYLYVQARSRQRAKVLALRAWRRAWKGKWRDRPGFVSGENPFTGMKVSLFDRCDWDAEEAMAWERQA